MSFAYNTPIQYIPGIGWRTAEVLHTLGVHTAGQLTRVPEKMLIELFGPSIRAVTQIVHVTHPSFQRKSCAPVIKTSTVATVSMPVAKEKTNFFKRLRVASQFMALL